MEDLKGNRNDIVNLPDELFSRKCIYLHMHQKKKKKKVVETRKRPKDRLGYWNVKKKLSWEFEISLMTNK